MKWFLPALTGFLLAASFPKIGQGYLAWIAFVPLIVFFWRANNPAKAFGGGFLSGVVHLFFLQIWIPDVLMHYGGLSGVLAWAAYGLTLILLSLFLGAACLLTNYLVRRGGEFFLFSFPFILVSLEYVQNYFPFGGYPWILTGYSQSNYLRIIQIADLTSVFGVSFLILFSNVAIVWMGMHWKRRFKGTGPLIAGASLLILCLMYGTIELRHWDAMQPKFRVAMLQGNISYDESAGVMAEKIRRGYVRMAESLKSSHVDLLLIPESPSPISFQYDSDYRQTCELLAKRFSMGLVFNNNREEKIGNREQYYNSAYFLNHDGNVVDVYDKMHLVPFGEYIPMKNLFQSIQTISKDVSEYSRGDKYRIVKIGDHAANAVICFEIVFPGHVRRFIRQGSQLILNLTNDGWYGDSSAPYQHLAIARWRAIENRRFLLRAANSGVSAIIEPTGRIQTSTGILYEAVCKGRFEFIKQMTFYTCYGDVFVFVCVIIATGFFVMAIKRDQRPKKR
jgi:apolipoprotein N-acyltransferase